MTQIRLFNKMENYVIAFNGTDGFGPIYSFVRLVRFKGGRKLRRNRFVYYTIRKRLVEMINHSYPNFLSLEITSGENLMRKTVLSVLLSP